MLDKNTSDIVRTNKLRDEYINIRKEIETLRKKQISKLEQMQSGCGHPLIAERDYIPQTLLNLNHIPPARICEVCGYEEEGWGTGYKTLKETDARIIRKVREEDFYKLRSPLHKLPLINQ